MSITVTRFTFSNEALALTILLALSLVCVYIAYGLALSGPFLFDDFANLKVLGDYNGVNSWQDVRAFISSGFAGPTGRPVALLSFLLDDNAWPSDATSFKHTNVMLHLLIALVAVLVLNRVAIEMGIGRDKAICIALIASILWSVHPYHVSTVMYVVQRMAMLVTLFGLLAIGSYCLARSACMNSRYSYTIIAVFAAAVFALLGLFSKENAAVLIPILWVMERYLFQPSPHRYWQEWMPRLLGMVSVLMILYLCWNLYSHFSQPWDNRDFNAWQRLITQPKILGLYLFDILLPKAMTAGVYHDYIDASKSVFESYSTTITVVLMSASILGALIARGRLRWIAGIWLLFLAGHMIESSTLNLELYFEHRNYWPSLFLCLGAAIGLGSLSRYRMLIVLSLVAIFCVILTLRAELWGDREVLLRSWEAKNPRSERLSMALAVDAMNRGDYAGSMSRVNYVLTLAPDNPKAYYYKMALDCVSSLKSDPKDSEFYEDMLIASREYHWMPATANYLEYILSIKRATGCPLIEYQRLHDIYDALLQNPKTTDMGRSQVLDFKAQTYVSQEMPEHAWVYFKKAYEHIQKQFYLYKAAALMGSSGHPQYGLELLEMTPMGIREDEQYRILRSHLIEDIEAHRDRSS